MKHSTRTPTKYEAERIEALKRLGCVACAVLGVPNLNELELHHILDGGKRMGHWFSIFLCAGHHQGRWTQGQLDWIEPEKRLAISDGRKLFNAVYGTERSLWERVQKKLKLPLIWPLSKRVPRGVSHEMGLSLEGSAGPVLVGADALDAAGESTASGETIRAAAIAGDAP